MALSKRQKLLVGLCAIGLAVFLMDRLRATPAVPGPQDALASVAGLDTVPLAESPADVPADTTDAVMDGAGDALAGRLKTAIGNAPFQVDDMRDAFQPPAAWMPGASGNPLRGTIGSAAEAFVQKHTLKAVMVGAKGYQAIIDNTCVGFGQTIDGFKLVSVGERGVVLVSEDGSRVTLELPVNADGREE
jgi:hypothetical protein